MYLVISNGPDQISVQDFLSKNSQKLKDNGAYIDPSYTSPVIIKPYQLVLFLINSKYKTVEICKLDRNREFEEIVYMPSEGDYK